MAHLELLLYKQPDDSYAEEVQTALAKLEGQCKKMLSSQEADISVCFKAIKDIPYALNPMPNYVAISFFLHEYGEDGEKALKKALDNDRAEDSDYLT